MHLLEDLVILNTFAYYSQMKKQQNYILEKKKNEYCLASKLCPLFSVQPVQGILDKKYLVKDVLPLRVPVLAQHVVPFTARLP